MFHVPESFRVPKSKDPVFGSDSSVGNAGLFMIPHHRIDKYFYQCIASDGMGWEHVSVTLYSPKRKVDRCPTWEEMCYVKGLFWGIQDCVAEFHPPQENYVTNHDYCLHLWRPIGISMPMPDPAMVGVKSDKL